MNDATEIYNKGLDMMSLKNEPSISSQFSSQAAKLEEFMIGSASAPAKSSVSKYIQGCT